MKFQSYIKKFSTARNYFSVCYTRRNFISIETDISILLHVVSLAAYAVCRISYVLGTKWLKLLL